MKQDSAPTLLASPATPWRTTAWLLLPVVVLGAILALLIFGKPLERLTADAPPVEKVSIERVRLTPGLITLHIRADGSQPITIAQVQVDAAFRLFTINPPGPIGRLGTARIEIPDDEMVKLNGQKLTPGMPADIQIATTSRSALSYLTKPIEDSFRKAFRER